MVHRSLDGKKTSLLTLTFAQYSKRELVGSDSTLGGKMGANRQQIGKCSGRQNGKFHSTHQTADPGHICCPSSSLIFAAAPKPPHIRCLQTSHIRCLSSRPQVAGRFQIAELGQNVKFDTLARAGDLSPPQWRSSCCKVLQFYFFKLNSSQLKYNRL